MARILITAGGTREKIDNVRSIQNTSSGRLAAVIADSLVDDFEIDYIHSSSAILPQSYKRLKSYVVDSVNEVYFRVCDLLKDNYYDVIIHAMAISDFYVNNIYSQEALYRDKRSLDDFILHEAKISSDKKVLIELQPAPKVIRLFKEVQPEAILFGFKLLSNATDEALIEAAKQQIDEVKSDYVIANHKEKVSHDKHEAYLLDRDKILSICRTKEEIAIGIKQIILERLR